MSDIQLTKLKNWIDTYSPEEYRPISKIDASGTKVGLTQLSSQILKAFQDNQLSFEEVERAHAKLKVMNQIKHEHKVVKYYSTVSDIATALLPGVKPKKEVEDTLVVLDSTIQTKQKIHAQIESQFSSQLTDADPIFKKQTERMIHAASKILALNQSLDSIEIEIDDKKIVAMKGKDEEFELLARGRLLGTGQTGDVYLAKSIGESKEVVLKYSKAEADEDLENELKILTILNRDSSHEGVQGLITVSSMTFLSDSSLTAPVTKVTKGKIYSQGDFQKQVEVLRMTKMLGITKEELLEMPEEKLREKVQEKLGSLSAKFEEIRSQRLEPIEEDRRLAADFWPLMSDVALSIEVLLGQESAESLKARLGGKSEDVEQELSSADFNELFTNLLLESAKKCKRQPKVSNDSLAKMTGNLVAGLMHIHASGIIHGDIKPRNVFWSQSEAVIADFGGSQPKGSQKALQTTDKYASPDYLDAVRKYKRTGDVENQFRAGQGLDICALGMTIFEMYTGEMPNGDKIKSVGEEREKWMGALQEKGMSEEAAKIVIKMVSPVAVEEVDGHFPLPVEKEELSQLYILLSGQVKQSPSGDQVGGFITGL